MNKPIPVSDRNILKMKFKQKMYLQKNQIRNIFKQINNKKGLLYYRRILAEKIILKMKLRNLK